MLSRLRIPLFRSNLPARRRISNPPNSEGIESMGPDVPDSYPPRRRLDAKPTLDSLNKDLNFVHGDLYTLRDLNHLHYNRLMLEIRMIHSHQRSLDFEMKRLNTKSNYRLYLLIFSGCIALSLSSFDMLRF